MPPVRFPSTFFGSVDDKIRRKIESRARQVKLRKGQVLIEHGARSTDVFFLVEGELRVLVYSSDGREVSVRTLMPGEMVGELAAIDGMPRSATVVSLVPSVVVELNRSDFLECVQSSPGAALLLARQFARQIRSLTDKIFELSALNVRSRLHCELFRLASVSGVETNQARLSPAPTHAEIANRIGTHREAVTREMSHLAKQGVITQLRRQVQINDVSALARLAGRSDARKPS